MTQPAQIIPAPPRTPDRITDPVMREYLNQLNRWLESFVRQQTGLPYLRGSGLYLDGLPTSGYGLKPNEVFANDGILTIVRADDIWAGGFAIAVSVGSVTVTV